MKRRWLAAGALTVLMMLPLAGCPVIPPPPPPAVTDLGDFLRARLADKDEAGPLDIADDDQFDTDDEADDFADVLTDPAFSVD